MPKVNRLRSLANERNVADRIRFEREKREWTYEGLASRMTHLGNPMQASAIYKIEKADPPRRITVDEMVGFSQVFDLDPADMLMPMGKVLDGEAARILGQLRGDLKTIFRTIDSMVAAHIALYRLEASSKDSDREILTRVLTSMPSGSVYYPLGPDNSPWAETVSPDPINRAWGDMAQGFKDYANWFVNERKS